MNVADFVVVLSSFNHTANLSAHRRYTRLTSQFSLFDHFDLNRTPLCLPKERAVCVWTPEASFSLFLPFPLSSATNRLTTAASYLFYGYTLLWHIRTSNYHRFRQLLSLSLSLSLAAKFRQ